MSNLPIERSLKVDFSWMLAGNICYSACQWLVVVILAKLGSPVQVGEYALGLALPAPVILFANLQLRSLLASDVKDRFEFGQYVMFRLVSLAAAFGVVTLVAWTTQAPGTVGIIMLVCAAQIVELISETFYGFMQRHDRMDRISWSLMARGPLSLGAMWLAMYLTHSTVWALIALAAARVAVLIGWDSKLGFAGPGEQVRLRWNAPDMRELLSMALPLGVISMIGSLNANIPRYFVQAHWGSAELGMFSAVASLLSAGNLVVSAYGQAIFLSVARACASFDRARFRKFAMLTIAMGIVLGGCAIVISEAFGRVLLTHLFRPEYGNYADVLVRLMIAGTVNFVACGLGFVMTAARSLRPQVPLLIATGAVTALAAFVLVPGSGLMGAANSMLVGAVVQLLGTVGILARADRRLYRVTVKSEKRPAAQTASVEVGLA